MTFENTNTTPDWSGYYDAINWDAVKDPVDKMTLDKLNSQFWLDTRIPVSNDLDDWRVMTSVEKDLINRVFGGLTLLDTLQSQDGIQAIRNDAITPHEVAVLNNIQFMESIHAKSYSTIFITLNTRKVIEDVFTWTSSNPRVQLKAKLINEIYSLDSEAHPLNALKKKAASVLLETFLFYSGFYAPLFFLGNNRLSSVGEIIKLIIRDESVHGTYIGYKFKKGFKQLTPEQQAELTNWVNTLAMDLYLNELDYTEEVYGEIGWTEDVVRFLEYNGSKAFQNLGLPSIFTVNIDDVNPVVLNGIQSTATNHDFFSKVGNSYVMGNAEAMADTDYKEGAWRGHRTK